MIILDTDHPSSCRWACGAGDLKGSLVPILRMTPSKEGVAVRKVIIQELIYLSADLQRPRSIDCTLPEGFQGFSW